MQPLLRDRVRFSFHDTADFAEVEGTLALSRLAAGILHGPERVELEVSCQIDPLRRTVTIDGGTDPGRTLSVIFLGLARREFGAVTVHRTEPADAGEVRS